MTPTDEDRIGHIIEAIALIEKWNTEHPHDDLFRSGVIRQLEIIGEAATRLSDTVKSAHPAIEWKSITGFRIQAAHRYWDTDWSEIEQIIAEDLPILRKALVLLREQQSEQQVEVEMPKS
ncbi:MAG: DUF86 domain-containing protein [Acidimicrobiaceae bacterium]|nr:DUF86 domain-containing protein [Acidimicrobiaceae bacterium]